MPDGPDQICTACRHSVPEGWVARRPWGREAFHAAEDIFGAKDELQTQLNIYVRGSEEIMRDIAKNPQLTKSVAALSVIQAQVLQATTQINGVLDMSLRQAKDPRRNYAETYLGWTRSMVANAQDLLRAAEANGLADQKTLKIARQRLDAARAHLDAALKQAAR